MESSDESDAVLLLVLDESMSCGFRSTCRWMMDAGECDDDELLDDGGDDDGRSGVVPMPRIVLRFIMPADVCVRSLSEYVRNVYSI